MTPKSTENKTSFSSVGIVVRYTAPNDLELSGDRDSLINLAAHLASISGETQLKLSIPANRGAEPYSEFLDIIQILPTSGNVHVSVLENSLRIEGSVAKIRDLAESIETFAHQDDETEGVGSHLHIEYYPDHFVLSSGSIPLVVALK